MRAPGFAVAFALALALPLQLALANPRPFPFSYHYETSAPGETELEQYVDLTPVRALTLEGTTGTQPRALLQTELEHGLTDRLELGLYLAFAAEPALGSGTTPFIFSGVKQRLRLRLAEPEEWPVDVGLYLELAELVDEFEVEAKVLLQRRFGRARAVVNLGVEREWYFNGDREWVLNPTAGVSFELHPAAQLGLEYWFHVELADGGRPAGGDSFNADPHHFVGPVLLWQLTGMWWALGAYVRVDGLERPAALGDRFGRVWVRSLIGLHL